MDDMISPIRRRASCRSRVLTVAIGGLLAAALAFTNSAAQPQADRLATGPDVVALPDRPIDQEGDPADEPPVTYKRVDTWTSAPPVLDGRPLPWPEGHDAAGLGVDSATDRPQTTVSLGA